MLRTDATGRFALRVCRQGRRAPFGFATGEGPVYGRPPATSCCWRRRGPRSRPSRRLVRNGRGVTFRGRLRGGPRPRRRQADRPPGLLPGRLAHVRRPPHRRSAADGAYRYRFAATRGVVGYRFRARIRREAAYPYELGYSRVVRVTVRRQVARTGRPSAGHSGTTADGTRVSNNTARVIDKQATPRAGGAAAGGPQGPQPLPEPRPERVPDSARPLRRARVAARRRRARAARGLASTTSSARS